MSAHGVPSVLVPARMTAPGDDPDGTWVVEIHSSHDCGSDPAT